MGECPDSVVRAPSECLLDEGGASVGPAWMLDLPGVEEENPDGPLRGGVVSTGNEPAGLHQ